MEIYKPYPGDQRYHVSNYGNVRSLINPCLPKQLKPCDGPRGHKLIQIYGKRDTALPVFIHRMVLETFVGPGEDLVCRHLNGIPWDNRLDNLKWGTQYENVQDREKHRKEKKDA